VSDPKDDAPNARFAPSVTAWEDIGQAVSDAMQSVYLGRAQPAAALNAAAEKANQSLGKQCDCGNRDLMYTSARPVRREWCEVK
jgi:maltose-binding protein MalE